MARTRRQRSPRTETPTRVYKWTRAGFGVPAQVVGEELERLEIKPGDFHRTHDVLDEARDPDNPLHGCFTWDDEKAAEMRRLDECRAMIRSIAYVVVRDGRRVKQPVYCHLTDDEGPKYVKADRVATEEEVRRKAMDEALALLTGVRKRFDFITELRPVFEAIDRATEGL